MAAMSIPLALRARKNDPLLIGLVGTAGVGKDTAAERLVDMHDFIQHAFALPIKTMLEALFLECGIDYARLFEPKLKEQPIPELAGVAQPGQPELTPRALMQTLGTEWGRQMGHGLWLRCADLMLGLPDAPVHDRIVISDVRFPNEADWVRQHGGVLVRIVRPDAMAVREHFSEQLAGGIKCDATVANTGSLADLHETLDDLMYALTGAAPRRAA